MFNIYLQGTILPEFCRSDFILYILSLYNYHSEAFSGTLYGFTTTTYQSWLCMDMYSRRISKRLIPGCELRIID